MPETEGIDALVVDGIRFNATSGDDNRSYNRVSGNDESENIEQVTEISCWTQSMEAFKAELVTYHTQNMQLSIFLDVQDEKLTLGHHGTPAIQYRIGDYELLRKSMVSHGQQEKCRKNGSRRLAYRQVLWSIFSRHVPIMPSQPIFHSYSTSLVGEKIS